MRIRKNKFKLKSKPVTRSISTKLDKLIKQVQREGQRKENISFGRKSQTYTYQFASNELAKLMEGRLK